MLKFYLHFTPSLSIFWIRISFFFLWLHPFTWISLVLSIKHMFLIKYIFHLLVLCLGNYYGTPKPPAEPSPVQPDLVDQVLFDEDFDTEVQRKRTTSVSKMDRKDSAAPEEEEEEERPPMVNGVGG